MKNNISIINGNLLEADADIICHQVNCKGVMGRGLAKQIKDAYPQVYASYKETCKTNNFSQKLLGAVDFVKVDKYLVASCFGQFAYGTKTRQTNYNALGCCFDVIKEVAEDDGLTTIAIPYNIGCGLAGGEWSVVERLIDEIFGDTNLIIKIYKL